MLVTLFSFAQSPAHALQLKRSGTRQYVLGSIIQEVKLMVLREAKARDLREYEIQRQQSFKQKKLVCALDLCARTCTTRRFYANACHVIPKQQRSHIQHIYAQQITDTFARTLFYAL